MKLVFPILVALSLIVCATSFTILNKYCLDKADGRYVHPNCDYYYGCVGGNTYEVPCQPGLHYNPLKNPESNPTIGYCDPPAIAKCTTGDSADPCVDVDCSKAPDGDYRNFENCNSFISCSNGNRYVMPCQEDFLFSESEKKCLAPFEAQCKVCAKCSSTT